MHKINKAFFAAGATVLWIVSFCYLVSSSPSSETGGADVNAVPSVVYTEGQVKVQDDEVYGHDGNEWVFVETRAGQDIWEVTAYCPCELCCGCFSDGFTASGVAAIGCLVAAPQEISFGTKLSIPGYCGGYPVTVQDRGGAIKGNRLDVLFPTHQKALEWGVKRFNVQFLPDE